MGTWEIYCTYTWTGNYTIPDTTPCVDQYLNAQSTVAIEKIITDEFISEFSTAEATVIVAWSFLYLAILIFRKYVR